MSQQIIENALVEEHNMSKSEADRVLKTIIQTIENGVMEKGSFEIKGIGVIKVTHRKARKGRNPRTGEALDIAAKNYCKIKPWKNLRDAAEAYA